MNRQTQLIIRLAWAIACAAPVIIPGCSPARGATSGVTAADDGTLAQPTNFWAANAAAISNAINASLFVPNTRLLSTSGSLTGGGNLTADRTIQLIGDSGSPGASRYYGTDGSGTKGWHTLPSGGGTNGISDAPSDSVAYARRNASWIGLDFTLIPGTASDSQIPSVIARDAEIAAAYPPNARSLTGANSISGGGNLSADRTFQLVGDSASPGASRYYGTDGAGAKGWYTLPSGGGTNGISDAPSDSVAYVRRNASWIGLDFTLIPGTASDSQIPSAVARDIEVAALLAGYQQTNAAAADLSDGILSAERVARQSGRLPGRAESFGQVVRNIGTNEPIAAPTDPQLLLLTLIGGQSLATGSGGVTNSFSTTPRFPGFSLMWTQGVHHGEPGTGNVAIAASGLTAVTNLYANVVSGPTRSENPIVAAVDSWQTVWSNRLGGQRVRVLAAGHALGGANLDSIDEGTASYSNFVAHVDGAKALADAQGWRLMAPVWFFVHGENDTYDGTPTEAYRTNFVRMLDAANAKVKTSTGQSNDLVVIMSQTASATYENVASSNSFPAFAQYLLTYADPRTKVATPTYIFPTVADGVHLTNVISAWLGEYLSKAARRDLFGEGWRPTMPTNVAIIGTNVVLRYHVPRPPLVFDTTQVSNPGNYGFSIVGATIGTPLIEGNKVLIPFTAGTPTRVKYGVNGTIGQPDGPTTGQRGNLRDSDPEIGSLTGSNSYNWSLIFDLPTTIPATPTSIAATGSNGKMTLSWSRMPDTAWYVIRRSTVSGGPYELLTTTAATRFEDTAVSAGTVYYYTVAGHGPSGDSTASAEVLGTTSGGGSITRDWVPTDLGSKLAGWYRASSIAVGDGVPIDTWVDESGSGHNLTASSTLRPTQQTVGGRKVVRFDGANDQLDSTSIGARFSSVAEANFWTVARPNTTNLPTGNRNLWYLSRATNGSVRLALSQSSVTPGRWRYGGSRVDGDSTDNDDSGTLIDTNSTVIIQAKFDFANAKKSLTTNGVLDHSDATFASAGTTASESLSLMRLGASALAPGGTPTNWYDGDIEMHVITVGALTTNEVQRVEGYIAWALGLTNLLASGHPYKTEAPKITTGSGGTGDVIGPASSTVGDLAIYDAVTGKLIRAGGPFRVAQSNLVAVGAVTNYVADLTLAPIQLLIATNDVNIIHATNAAAGRGATMLIQASGANRTISLPSNIKRTRNSIVVTNGSVLPLNFYSWGSDNTNVLATFGMEGY